MTILVPIKRVVDPYARVRPLADGSGLDIGSAKFDVNPFDEIAMEQAVRFKESDPSVRVVAVSVGGPECEEQLRKALAMGADEAVLVDTLDELDPGVVAAELGSVCLAQGPDLVLMGKQATDDDSNQVGQMLAARLGWPQATFAAQVELREGSVTVVRETDNGEQTVRMPLPAVVTVDLRLNEPRYIALPGIVRARSKPLARVPRATTATVKTRVLDYSSPPSREAGNKVADVGELVAALKSRGVL